MKTEGGRKAAVIMALFERLDARQAHSGMTKQRHSRTGLAGIQDKLMTLYLCVISRSEATRNLIMVNTKDYFVYLLTNWNNRVIYVGVSNDLCRRIYEHKHKLVAGFTSKYNLYKLVYFEQTNDVNVAIAREKEIKKWRREKKNRLVEMINPEWNDLSNKI